MTEPGQEPISPKVGTIPTDGARCYIGGCDPRTSFCLSGARGGPDATGRASLHLFYVEVMGLLGVPAGPVSGRCGSIRGTWGRQPIHVLVAVAIGTLQRGVLVDHDLFIRDLLRLLVALIAGHIGMATGKREVGLGVVVEGGRFPLRGRVTVCAMGGVVLGEELPVVHVLVTGFALLRRALEARLGRGRCFVAIRAGNCAVGTEQWEFRS